MSFIFRFVLYTSWETLPLQLLSMQCEYHIFLYHLYTDLNLILPPALQEQNCSGDCASGD